MEGIQYFVDDQGVRQSSLIDLNLHGELWEDFLDSMLIGSRKDVPSEDGETVKNRLGLSR